MKKLLTAVAALLLLFSVTSNAQDSTKCSADFKIGADFMSRYVWRGLSLGGESPSIQPVMRLDLGSTDHKFSIGAWGAYTFGPTANQEIDLFASYTFKELLTVVVTDYFFPGLNTGVKNDYFRYSKDSTGHVFEGALLFNGTKKIPFTFMVATNFYGNDAKKMKEVTDSTFTEDGIQYSTYLEIGFKKNIKGFDFNVFAGGTINSQDTGLNEIGYYSNTKAGFTNVGFKLARTIPVTDKFSIPVQASLIANPMQNRLYLVFGFSL